MLTKTLKEIEILTGFCSTIKISENSYYIKNPAELNVIGIEMNQSYSIGMGLKENTNVSQPLAYKNAA